MGFKFGDYVVYDPGYVREIGRVTKCVGKNVFVCYTQGCTASCTPIEYLRHATDFEIASAQNGIGFHRFDDYCPKREDAYCFMCKAKRIDSEAMNKYDEQIKDLRDTAHKLNRHDEYKHLGHIMDEAADTIESLHNKMAVKQ